MKDVRLPKEMQRAMASEAEATRDARAKVDVIINKTILELQTNQGKTKINSNLSN